jgi:hypothetical protein
MKLLIDEYPPECPYCKKPLARLAERKTRCPHCRGFMYVRTRPEDRARVVVTEIEARAIDQDWQIVGNAREPRISWVAEDSQIRATRTQLQEVFLAPPSEDEVAWAILQNNILRCLGDGQVGSARNICQWMADFLARCWRLREALRTYLFVCALDLNSNFQGLSPQPLEQITRISKKLLFEKADVASIFSEIHVTTTGLLPFDFWPYLENAIWPNSDDLKSPVVKGMIEQVIKLPNGREEKMWRSISTLGRSEG